MGVGSGGQGTMAQPWIFIHGTNLVDKGLKVLFFGVFYFSVFFSVASIFPPPPLKEAFNSAIFRSFLLFFSIFSVGPLP